MTATAAGPAAQIEPRHKGLLILAVMAATIMQVLDTTIANVALPHMQASLGATLDNVTWVLTSYIVATAIITPITGWLSERFGQRSLFLFAVAGFVGASVLCGTATSLEEMVLFRVIQGLTGALLAPLSQSIMFEIYPPDQGPKAMSIWGTGVMVGPVMGPMIGALLTDHLNWRWVFYVNVPLGIAAFALLFWLLPDKPRTQRRLDYVGFGSLALAAAAFQMMLDRGHQVDWFESGEIWVEAGLALTGLWIFGVQMATSANPLFARSLFRDRSLILSLFFMIVIGIVAFSSMAVLPPMLQGLLGYTVFDTGVLLGARGVGVMITMALSGRLLARFDPRIVVATGFAIVTWSAWLMSGWSLDVNEYQVALSGFIQGLGTGMVFIPLNMLAFATLSAQMRTDAAALLALVRNVGASVGISVMTVMLSRNWQVSHADLASHVTATSLAPVDPELIAKSGVAGEMLASAADAMINRQALMVAYVDDFYLLMWVSLVAIPLVLLMRKPKAGAKAAPVME